MSFIQSFIENDMFWWSWKGLEIQKTGFLSVLSCFLVCLFVLFSELVLFSLKQTIVFVCLCWNHAHFSWIHCKLFTRLKFKGTLSYSIVFLFCMQECLKVLDFQFRFVLECWSSVLNFLFEDLTSILEIKNWWLSLLGNCFWKHFGLWKSWRSEVFISFDVHSLHFLNIRFRVRW